MWTKARQLVLGVAVVLWIVSAAMLTAHWDTFAAILIGLMLVGIGFCMYAESKENNNGST